MHRSSRHLAGALAALGCVTLSAACASQPQQEPREVAITSMSPEVMDDLAERIAARVVVPAPAIAVAPARRAPVLRRPVQPRVFAVPVPPGRAVTVDGKLDDWDLSGQIGMFVVSETAASQLCFF